MIKGTGEPRPVIPVQEALRELEANLHRAFQTGCLEEITETGWFTTWPTLLNRKRSYLRPERLKLGSEGRSYAHVDAHGGKILLDY